jgi:hypothetical protein
MKNLKLELFEFKKGLKFEQSDISNIVESHMSACDIHSEKRVIESLNERLSIFTYHNEVKGLLESLNNDVRDYELLYNLKDLYRVVESRNAGGTIYRQPLNVIFQIINSEDDQTRMGKILNELAIYDWVPEIKLFVHNLTKSPETKANLLSGGSCENVYTLVESCESGHVAYIADSWFLLSEDKIEKCLLEDHVDGDKLRLMRTLESAMKMAEITNERVNFKIAEDIVVGISVENKGITFINEDAMNKETTLENLFQSPIIPLVNKNFYPLIREMADNVEKLVELDVVKKVGNLTQPFKDVYCFNYKDNLYTYSVDTRYGNSFFKYESAIELVDDVRNEMNYDLTNFYENKVGKEVKVRRRLEDKVREINVEIEDLDRNIEKVEANVQMLGESKVLKSALKSLNKQKNVKTEELTAIKGLLYNEISKA